MRRGTVVATAAVLVALGSRTAFSQSPSPSPAPLCQKADALRTAGLLDDARRTYAEELAKPGSETCVTAGLKGLARQYLARGETLQRSGLTDAAATAFTAAFDLDPTLGDEVVQALGEKRSLALAQQLDERGLAADARKLVEETLKKYPDADVPVSLDHLLAGDRTPRWTRFLERVTPVARTLGEILLLVLLAFLVGQFVFSRTHRRLRIDEFRGPAADGSDAKVTLASTEFQALVRSRVLAIARARRGTDRVDLADSSGGPVAIPATVTKAVPQTAFLDAILQLVQYLLPPRDRPLTGLLLTASPSRGLGVTVTLSSRFGRQRATRTFWADELPEAAFAATGPASYLPFVVVVAAWTLREFRRRPFRALGTEDPMSYAAFAIAAAEQGAAW